MQDIYDILAKHYTGEASAEEETQIAAWKLENQEEYEQLAEAWNAVPDAIAKDSVFKQYDHKAALSKIEGQLGGSTQVQETKVFRLNNVFKYAAAASIVLLIGIGSIWMMSGTDFTNVTNDSATAMEVNLPDGSTVWLAEDASLDYATDFENDRSLKLAGEAFFEVVRDTLFPFNVSTANGNVEVLGTAFNIDATESTTEVSVDHGLVAFTNSGKEVKLTVDQAAISTSSGVSGIEKVDENYLSWKNGEFHFENTSLTEVLELMNKFYVIETVCEREITSNDEITGDFVQAPIEDLIDVIVLTCGLEAEYGEETISLK